MLLTFSSAVSVYQLANQGLVTADVVSGEWQGYSSRQKLSQFHFGSPEPLHVAALQSCQDAAEQAISSWRSVVQPSCWLLLLLLIAVWFALKARVMKSSWHRPIGPACM